MKRIRCPKCDHYQTFDETQYTEGQTLVFECPECHRQFGVRIGTSTLLATRKDERLKKESSSHAEIYNGISPLDQDSKTYGSLIVIENVFHYKQTLPLKMGDNVIGRYVKGSNISTPIETVDPSVDTTHCIINVKRDRHDKLVFTLRDATPDGTGTFVGNTILKPQDRWQLEDGTVITIGATTMIFQAQAPKEGE